MLPVVVLTIDLVPVGVLPDTLTCDNVVPVSSASTRGSCALLPAAALAFCLGFVNGIIPVGLVPSWGSESVATSGIDERSRSVADVLSLLMDCNSNC